MGEGVTTSTVKEVQSSIEAGPVAFVAAVGWSVALLFIALYIRQTMGRLGDAKAFATVTSTSETASRELMVKTLTTAARLAEVLDAQPQQPARRRRRPTSNPGRKPEGA